MQITLDAIDVRKMLNYDPESGKLFWQAREQAAKGWNTKWSGKEAFVTPHPEGYLQGALNNKRYLAHRVIWSIQTGEWPVGQIDHIDGDRANNKWANLRLATKSENGKNRRSNPGATSKYLGVYWHASSKKWCASIRAEGVNRHIGLFINERDAARAYNDVASQHHGPFARLNVLPEGDA